MFGYDRIRLRQSVYHRVETLIMPTRLEASIFLPMSIQSAALPRFLKQHNIKLFTWIIYACLQTVKMHPSLNRFVLNNRLYAHRFYSISTTVKQDKTQADNNHSVKLQFEVDTPVKKVQDALEREILSVRKRQSGTQNRLFGGLGMLPTFIFKLVLWGGRKLNDFDLLPNQIIKDDPLHSSVMIANLGSIQGQSVFHHLFNWGTTSMFIAFGHLDDTGHLDLTITLDERISEGLLFFKALNTFKMILENPDEYYS
jgi:hypothetical protein